MNRAAAIKTCVAGGVVIVLLGGGIVWLMNRDGDRRTWRYWQKRLPQSTAEARAAGLRITMEDAREPEPPGVNGASALQAFSDPYLASASARTRHFFANRYYRTLPESRADIRKALRDVEPHLPGMLAACQSDFYRWDISDPLDLNLRLSQTSDVVDTLTSAATGLALEGDTRYLEPAFAANRNVRRWIRDVGTARSHARAGGIQGKAINNLMLLAASPKVDAAVVRRLLATIEDGDLSLKEGLRNNTVYDLRSFWPQERYVLEQYTRSPERWREAAQPTRLVDWQTFLQAPGSALKESFTSFRMVDAVRQWKLLDKPRLDVTRRKWLSPPIASAWKSASNSMDGENTWPIDTYWDADFEGVISSDVRGEIDRDMKRAAIEIHLFRRAHGRWPKSLGDVPNVPRDLWTGMNFFYQVHPDRFYVWSVGPDGQNDWGRGRYGGPPGEDDFCYESKGWF